MRILLTAHQFLPEHASGTEILTWQAARELRRRGHHVTIATAIWDRRKLADVDRFDTYTFDGFTVERFRHDFVPMGGVNDRVQLEMDNPLTKAWFARVLQEHHIEHVHFFHLARLSASVVDAADEARIPMTLTATDFWAVCPLYQLRLEDHRPCDGPDGDAANCVQHLAEVASGTLPGHVFGRIPAPFARLAVKAAHRMAPLHPRFAEIRSTGRRLGHLRERVNKMKKIFVPTAWTRDVLVSQGVEAGRIHTQVYGIDVTGLPRKPISLPAGAIRIGFIGTMSNHKGPQVLVEAVRGLAPEVEVEVRFYGRLEQNPPFAAKLLKAARGDGRIQFLGGFPPEQLGNVLENLDVLVVPSVWHENAPLVLLSAQAMGRPVVASRVGGMKDLVRDGVDGLLVEPNNPAELARAIARLAQDRAGLAAMAHAAPPASTIEVYVDALEAAFNAGVSA